MGVGPQVRRLQYREMADDRDQTMNDNADFVKNADFVDLALERILAITWETNWDRRESVYALLREYFRRVGLWRDALSPDDVLSPDTVLHFHLYDLSSAVAPMPQSVEEKIESVWEVHQEELRRKSLSQQPAKVSRNGKAQIARQSDRTDRAFRGWASGQYGCTEVPTLVRSARLAEAAGDRSALSL